MKDRESAIVDISTLDDNRKEITIHHELIEGVSPKMIVWWFRNFPQNTDVPGSGMMTYKGRSIPAYRFWHPDDHISCIVKRSANDGSPGFGKDAIINTREKLGKHIFDVDLHVDRLDQSGLELNAYKGFVKIGEFQHYFIETLEGTICESSAVIGSFIPLIGRLFTPLVKWKVFTEEMSGDWILHNIEEMGNFQFFLPTLYEFGFEKAFK